MNKKSHKNVSSKKLFYNIFIAYLSENWMCKEINMHEI